MLSLIFCAFCAQKFWRVRTFSGNFLRILCPKPKRFLCPKSGEDQKKKKKQKSLHPKSIGVCVRKVYCGNFITNNNMSVQEYVCAQQICLWAQSLNSVCARTRAQLRGNTGRNPLKGGESSSQIRWFTIAKIELV